MADPNIVEVVQNYLQAIRTEGIPVSFGVLFGSQTTETSHRWSDIDLIVVSPAFDGAYPRAQKHKLWHIAGRVDNRIEPIPCGEKRWRDEAISPIILIARRDGQVISPRISVTE
jgi:predicted nucleotidyltransferase